jgi:hypothetical protein
VNAHVVIGYAVEITKEESAWVRDLLIPLHPQAIELPIIVRRRVFGADLLH